MTSAAGCGKSGMLLEAVMAVKTLGEPKFISK
jgi:hypothetical protein